MRKRDWQLNVSIETSEPRGFAVRFACIRLLQESVHRIPPRVRDDREPPLCETRWRGLVEMICPTGKAESFPEQGWTVGIRLKGFSKFDFTRKQRRLN
jgi:hypothetical protein